MQIESGVFGALPGKDTKCAKLCAQNNFFYETVITLKNRFNSLLKGWDVDLIFKYDLWH